MSLALAVTGVVLLVLPGLARTVGARLRPGEWARLSLASAWLGFRALQGGLLVTAIPAVLSAFGAHQAADACHRVLGPAVPGGSLSGWVAAVALVAMTVRGHQLRHRALRHQRAARIEPWLGVHHTAPDADLVVVPSQQVVAYAVPGPPVQVVISQGLVEALQADELDAVVRHELVHIHHRHDRYLLAATVLEGLLRWLPGVSTTAGVLRLGVERWADEEAASLLPQGRDAVRRALARATELMIGPVPAFSAVCTIAERLGALDSAAPSPRVRDRLAVGAPLFALVVIAPVCLMLWTTYTHHGMLGVVAFCPA